MIKVIVVDDHPVVRRGLKQIIAAEQIDRVESANPYTKISIPLQTSRFQMR